MGRFDKYNGNQGVPFMDGAEKIDTKDILNQPLHLTDYGFIHGRDGEFIVMQFRELPGRFAFGNSIVTQDVRAMEHDFGGKSNVLHELATATLTFVEKVSKAKRKYIAAIWDDDPATPAKPVVDVSVYDADIPF